MTCKAGYEEMMSLRLDGLLPDGEESDLDAHLAQCRECLPVWQALKEADSLLRESARTPAAVPQNLHANVMLRIASMPIEVVPPVLVHVPLVPEMAGAPRSVLQALPVHPLDGPHEWQHQLGGYLRAAAAVALSLVGTLGILLLLLVSGTLEFGGVFSPVTEVLQTLVGATGTWLRSLAVGLGPAALTVGGLLAGLLTFIGWQVVTGYHRSAIDQGALGFGEAAA